MDQQLVIKLTSNDGVIAPIGYVESPPILYTNLKALYPSVNFSDVATSSETEPYEYGVFEHATPPYDLEYTKSFDDVGITKQEDGIWRQTFVVRDATESEIAKRTKEKAIQQRNLRMLLLRRTDYIFAGDAPDNVVADKEAWRAYRQALRNVPSLPGFPWTHVMPLAPNPVVGNPTALTELTNPSLK